MNASEPPNTLEPYKKQQFDQYLTFCALGGMLVSDTGAIESMKLYEFCEKIGIAESTTRHWKRNTPDFGKLVRQRRGEVFSLARETAAYNRLYLIGMTSLPTNVHEVTNPITGRTQILRSGNLHNDQRAAVDALKTVLGSDGGLALPVQRQEVKVQNNLAELFSKAERQFLEGEISEPNRSVRDLPHTSTVAPEA